MRLPQRLTIRFKILIVTATLLLIFALTNFFSIRLSKGVVNELDTITDYFMLLSAIASQIDVETFEFELNLRRLIQESPLASSRLATIVARQIELAKRLEQEFSEVAQLIDTASRDVRNEVMERVELARIAGRFSMIRRDVKPFVQLGSTVLEAIKEDRSADAQRLSLGFSAFEEAFGPDLAEIRVAVNQLTRGSTVRRAAASGACPRTQRWLVLCGGPVWFRPVLGAHPSPRWRPAASPPCHTRGRGWSTLYRTTGDLEG
jgi:hypothetical protein